VKCKENIREKLTVIFVHTIIVFQRFKKIFIQAFWGGLMGDPRYYNRRSYISIITLFIIVYFIIL